MGIKLMKKQITEVLLASDKRKNILLLLQEGPLKMETLFESLDTTRSALLPQIKILRENHLIFKSQDTYELTTIGKLIVEEMVSFLSTAEMFGGNCEYFGTHFIDFIPPLFLKKLSQIGVGEVMEVSAEDFYDVDKEFLGKALESHEWLEITSALHPTFHDFYMEMIDHVTEVSVIITQEVYEKAKQEYYDDFKELIDLDLISIYMYPESPGFTSFIVAGQSIKFRLLTLKGVHDNKSISFSGPGALEWGRELFEYYRRQSVPIIEV
ncbi:helix-turn-helix transcriptional regulator [Methanolobus halotolerans]|uniref:Transcriptional regulator n=1 Tax=Methanolobus halotolerans TaxID=2052935 RepID=A0A4E0Q2R6_9EURY|nr:winged helix-turn-helix domain-containing protein [Methanolobus halotolerans]TGC07220.1 transcriptional regulator [Methanolobus halotolerans]